MESSPLVTFRSTVMIVCLVAVPLAAVLGTTLPEAVRSTIYSPPATSAPRIDRPVPAAGSLARQPAGPTIAQTEVDADHMDESAAHSGSPAPSAAAPPPVQPPTASITRVRSIPEPSSPEPLQPAAGLWTPGTDAASAQPEPATAPSVQGQAAARPAQVVPIGVDAGQPSGRASGPSGRAIRPTAWSQPPELSLDAFAPLERHLRDLGAVRYRLESWGQHGDLFRFQCQMAIDGHRRFTRHFEAVGSDPMTAARSVVEQIEAWHAGR